MLRGLYGLTQYAAEYANRNLGLLRNDGSIDNTAGGSNELDVTTLLAHFDEARPLKRRLISRNGCGLSRPNLDLDCAHLWGTRRVRRLKVQL
jgi:hypothetical protein